MMIGTVMTGGPETGKWGVFEGFNTQLQLPELPAVHKPAWVHLLQSEVGLQSDPELSESKVAPAVKLDESHLTQTYSIKTRGGWYCIGTHLSVLGEVGNGVTRLLDT